ncbi:MAG: TRAP transporter substrate-binding protein DctP [Gracilibacteraceae bacterium]|jgi:TRAP-type C4-dicarboxylate transport system substrate-binding protein|nr:TRAP transporter substrate-binding protein DctP [Gracilibacteraceae bacterium]
MSSKKCLPLMAGILCILFLVACSAGAPTTPTPTTPTTPTTPASGDSAAGADALAGAVQGMAPLNLNMATCLNSNHSGLIMMKNWAQRIEDATEGKIKITFYNDQSLVANSELVDALVNGVCDIIEVDPSYCSSWFTYSMAYFLPGQSYANNMAATGAALDMFTSSEWDLKEFQSFHIVAAYNMSLGGLGWSLNTAPRQLEDLRGLQIRATGYGLDGVSALGAVPVGMSMGDVYEAFVKNTIQGGAVTLETMVNFNFAECVKSYVVKPVAATPHIIAFNNDIWNSIPAEVQQVITEISREESLTIPGIWYESDQAGYKACQEKGVEVYYLDEEDDAAWTEAMAVCKQNWVQKMAAEGYPDGEAFLTWLDGLITANNAKYPTSEYDSFDFIER